MLHGNCSSIDFVLPPSSWRRLLSRISFLIISGGIIGGTDHPGLAASKHRDVIPLYVLDRRILSLSSGIISAPIIRGTDSRCSLSSATNDGSTAVLWFKLKYDLRVEDHAVCLMEWHSLVALNRKTIDGKKAIYKDLEMEGLSYSETEEKE